MADATLPLNPVTPLWNGVQISTAAPFPVQLFTSALSGWTYTNISVTGGTTVQVKASAGTIHAATVNNASTASTITLVDSVTTGATTPVIASFSGATTGTLTYDAAFTTGLIVIEATGGGTVVPSVTITYK